MNTEVVQVTPPELAITTAKDRFAAMAPEGVNFADEEIFAMQMLAKNDYVWKVACANTRSVQLAMLNVASTGLTLNPALGYAYLVPRDGEIKLDISYKGLIKIGTDTGAIKWCRPDVVYANDTFVYHGPATRPDVIANPFGDRGDIVGAYCVTKTSEGDILCGTMSREEIEAVRAKSDAWSRGNVGKKGPWESFFAEMCKKAMVKRDQKTWPRSTGPDQGRLATAVSIASDAEGGYTFDSTAEDIANKIPPAQMITDDRKERCDEAAEQYSDAVAAIKAAIESQSWDRMKMHWATIPTSAQMDLWLAPSKGGIFTTAERKLLREGGPQIAKEIDA